MLEEVSSYLDMLQEKRNDIRAAIQNLPEAALNWRPNAPETNAIINLAFHSASAEISWFKRVIAKEEYPRQRDSEFTMIATNAEPALRQLDWAQQEAERVLGALTEDTIRQSHERRGEQVSTRWIILHVIEHYAEHLGQIYLTRSLWEAQQRTDAH
ncbi:MAG: DUF664 domain-containing protein [Chloroflexi bacterium]|nr:DUF664 domain-containing protein [Chloroflexota bacterium]